MPIYKHCSRCGKRIEAGTTCQCLKDRHKEYDKYSRDRRSKQYYNSGEWEAVREHVLQLDEGLDVYVYMTQSIVIRADTVHHIVPLKENWNLRSNEDNLISLNHDTHSMIEQQYRKNKNEMQEALKAMVQQYRSEKG